MTKPSPSSDDRLPVVRRAMETYLDHLARAILRELDRRNGVTSSSPKIRPKSAR